MQFSRDFFDLNLRFAQKVSDVAGQSFQRSLLEYTHLYLAFGLGRDFDPENAAWQKYLHQIPRSGGQLSATTHRFYLERIAEHPKPEPEHPFGCFSYTLWDKDRVRVHFRNATMASGVLQKEKVPERISELKEMFRHLKKVVPANSMVIGGSWLYNIGAYRRLFPMTYLDSAQPSLEDYQFIALWGQFLFSDGSVRPCLAEAFLERMERQKTLEGLKSCFPYQVLRLQSSIQDFYTCYGIA